MNSISVKNLIISTLNDYGISLAIILASIILILAGSLIFREGYKFLTDQSYTLGGYYLRKVPYKGYNRFRSKKWNMEHM